MFFKAHRLKIGGIMGSEYKESEIYKEFHTLVGGKTAVYIFHRLSSCKFCDKIAVFSDGHIAEYGTHDELINIPSGIYAEMF